MSDEDTEEVNHIFLRRKDYAALGEYIAQCSLLEASLHGCLKHLLGLDENVMRLVVGEPRIGDLVVMVKRAAELRGWHGDQLALLNQLCLLVTENNKIRQVVAHKMVLRWERDELSFYGSVTAKRAGSPSIYKCTGAELANQSALLSTVATAFTYFTILREDQLKVIPRMVHEQLALRRSNPLPAIPNPQSQPKPPKQPRQPKASPE